jgi:hypothetical protein
MVVIEATGGADLRIGDTLTVNAGDRARQVSVAGMDVHRHPSRVGVLLRGATIEELPVGARVTKTPPP